LTLTPSLDDTENTKNTIVNLEYFIKNSITNWVESEWEFPKGRRNYLEKDLDCALREFEEETGIPKTTIKIIENIIPFEEIFIGTNNKSYKHKYFLAYTNSKCNLSNFQSSEVSKIEWKTIDECLTNIRPYNLEKKQLIVNINKILEEYRLY
jgi:8-oxo-dGTP pyrophosphatase MutT (NUDIX family)